MFSQLRQGSLVYILDKSDAPRLVTGQVVSATQPTPKYNVQNPAAMLGMHPEMVIDLKVKGGDKEWDLKQLPAGMSVEQRPDIKAVISDSREAMLQEVDMLQVQSQQVVDSYEYHCKAVEACEQIKRQLNPTYEKEQRRDEQLDVLSKRLDAFETKIGKALDKLLSKAEK